MSLGDLLPWITGGGGAIVVMAVGWYLLLTEKLVTGTQLTRALTQNEKLEAANDILRASLADEREQKAQLLSGGQLTNQLFSTLIAVATERRAEAAAPAAAPPPVAAAPGPGG